jgi:hypothetical protein
MGRDFQPAGASARPRCRWRHPPGRQWVPKLVRMQPRQADRAARWETTRETPEESWCRCGGAGPRSWNLHKGGRLTWLSTATETLYLGVRVRAMGMVVEWADHDLPRQIDERLDVAVDDGRAAQPDIT